MHSVPGEKVELDGYVITLDAVSGTYATWTVTAEEDGVACPAAGSAYLVDGSGDHIPLSRSVDWSCTTLREGETGRVRLLTDSRARAIQELVLLDSGGKTIVQWEIPQK